MLRSVIIALYALCVFTAGTAAAQSDNTSARKTLSVARVTTTIEEGQTWAKYRYDLIYYENLAWGVGRRKIKIEAFQQPIRKELKAEGFTVAGDPSDPFPEKKSSDFAIGAVLTDVHAEYVLAYPGNQNTSGTASMEVDWKIYSNLERRVVATIHTRGDGKAPASAGGFSTTLIAAMADNVKALTASSEFQKLILAPAASVPAPTSQLQTALALPGSIAAKPMKIADAVGAVVLVLSGAGHGSGFLVSSDGYLMTAAHVVQTDKYVKIRWSDGLEGVGEVIRGDKRRDVALIKTDPRGRQPLALNRTQPQPGDAVYAIGAPLELDLQSTVTKGVVSANRIKDGFSFIQSDVGINHGNSGGPLLDEKGQVLGIADQSDLVGDVVPLGINFFVPIGDALLFLKAEPR